jgi:peptidoglycan DL-endopeptidase CwlO
MAGRAFRPQFAVLAGRFRRLRYAAALMSWRRNLLFLLAVPVLLAAPSAGAEPDLGDRQSQMQGILAQIESLGEEVGAAAERFNGANYRLQQLSGELRTTQRELAEARKMHRAAQNRLAQRVVQVYTSDEGSSALDIVLGSESFSEMLDAIETRESILSQDATMVDEVRRYQGSVSTRVEALSRARNEQAAAVERRAAERASIAAKLDERQRLLVSVRGEIARLKAAERVRQAELARQALAAQARQRAAIAAAREEPSVEAQAAPATPPSAADTPPSPAPLADASRGAQVVAIAMRYLGVPYRWGGALPSTGFDCSGLTMYVFAQIGVSLPHYAAAQYGMGTPVSRDELAPGDLVFFRGLGHMGMYIGGGNFIHAPQTGDVVKISSLNEPYRVANWVGARRVL